MLFRTNPSSGVPIYLQLMEQVKHAIETGALRPGEQLPGIRPLAEEFVINPNTVAKTYSELEHEGIIELRHGAGAFVSAAAPARRGPTTCAPGSRLSPPRSRSCAPGALLTGRSGGCSRRSWPGCARLGGTVANGFVIETSGLAEALRARRAGRDSSRPRSSGPAGGSIHGFLGRNGAGVLFVAPAVSLPLTPRKR
jgi:DNA-binding transcriptional regulator YhcF (GntR family)